MAHYVHPITLDEIAKEVGMNRSAFCSYFKRCKGMTFSQFVTEYRLNTACELLKHSSKGVSEICYLVGFNDLPHFIRVFTKTIGISPSNIENNTSIRTLDFIKQAKAVTTNKIVTAWVANYNLIPRFRFFFLRNISAIS